MSADLSMRDEFAIRFYLDAIAGQASATQYFELRYRVSPQALGSTFVAVGDREGVLEQVALRAERGDVYVGCAPRFRRAGGKDAIREVWTLWAECDGASAASAALDFRPSPAMVVASGSEPNLHAYWPLARPVTPRVAENANHRLAHLLGADPVCFDAARILRPPATWNHKQLPPTRVELSHIRPGLRYELADVLERVPEVASDRIERRWRDQPKRRAGRDPCSGSRRRSMSASCSTSGQGVARRSTAPSTATRSRACTSTRPRSAAGPAFPGVAAGQSTTSRPACGAMRRAGATSSGSARRCSSDSRAS